jgi:hypothetical protein
LAALHGPFGKEEVARKHLYPTLLRVYGTHALRGVLTPQGLLWSAVFKDFSLNVIRDFLIRDYLIREKFVAPLEDKLYIYLFFFCCLIFV